MTNTKRYIALLGAALLALTTALMVGPAAELTTAETSVANDTTFKVSVEQGGSAPFNIYVGAFGALKCSATVLNPATAKVHTRYAVGSGGTVSSSTNSAVMNFFGGTPTGGPNCAVSWSSAPTPFNVPASVSTNAATPLGFYPSGCNTNPALGFSLPTTITNPSGPGGTLADGTRGKLCIQVVAPPPPADATPPLVDVSFPSAPAGQNGWFNANDVPVVGIVTATDASNVAALSCTDGASPLALSGVTGLGTMNASATTSVSSDGTHNIVCTATDGAVPANTGAATGSSNTATVSIDATAPTITAGVAPASPAASGWYNSASGAPTVSFTCSDDTSGLADPCPSWVTLGDGAGQSVSGSVTDNAGNSSSDGVTGINVDTTAPTLTASVVPAPAVSGWYNAATGTPTVSFACSDDTSGLADPCPSSVTLGDGADQSVSNSVTDNAGNSSSAAISDIDVDTVVPTITASIAPASPGLSGWYNAATGAPTVSFACSDGTSGLADACPSSVTLGDGENQSVPGFVTDNAGNFNSTAISDIDVDTIAPTITASITPASPDASGWYNAATGAPTVSFTCSDGTSGLADPCPSSVTLGDGADQSVPGSVTDNAGNSNATVISDIDVDTTAPTITASIAPSSPAASGWYNNATGAPTVSFTCSDVTSGLAELCPSSVTLGDGADQSVSGSVTDTAGNSSSATISNIDVDTIAPTITADIAPASPDASGWYNAATGAPTVSFTCSDGTSGLADPCPSSVTLGDGEDQSISGSVTDNAGNSNSDAISDIDVDTTLPTITASISPADAPSGWYNASTGAPTVSFTCSDATSGLAELCPPSVSLGDGADQSLSGSVTDNAGNSNSDAISDIDVDTTSPSLIASMAPASPAASGWYNASTGAPTVSFSCSDGTSGLAGACPPSVTLDDGENQSVSETIVDNAGNSSSAGISDIDVDITAPAITVSITPASPAASGWYNASTGAPTVSFTCSDATSGLAEPCPASVVVGDGADQSLSGSVTDNAGNLTSAAVSGIDVDTVSPTITTSIAPASPAASGWYNASTGAPTVSFACSDSTSGLAGACPSSVTLGDGENQFVHETVTDNAGNSNSDGITNIDVDATAPAITASIAPTSPAASGWYNASTGAPTVSFACSDATSGLSGPCPPSVTLGEGEDQSVSGSVTDNAGNSSSNAISNIDVDTTAPSVSVIGYSTGQVFHAGAPGTPPTPACASAVDGVSGVASSGGPALSGGGLNANGVGFASYQCWATDSAGNSGADTKTFFVYYGGASGILQPINTDNSSVFHRGKAVPVKFRLAGDEPSGYDTTGWLVQRIQVSCANLSVELAVEEVGSVTPATYFRYDPGADQYIYNADFRDKTVGSCWRVKVSLDDGFTAMYSAYFKIGK